MSGQGTQKWVNQLDGCGIEHPDDWQPKLLVRINGVDVGGDDDADALAHYLLQCGYPRDCPEHLRKVAELSVARRAAR